MTDIAYVYVRDIEAAQAAAAARTTGVVAWLRKNLFATPADTS